MTNLIPVTQIPPQSHSSLNTFVTCPKQYYHKYIARDVKFQPSYESEWGDKAHKHLELYLKANGNYTFPDERHKDTGQNMRDYQKYGDLLLNRAAQRGGYVLAERNFGVDHGKDTTDYWDKKAWLRGKIDVTIIYNSLGEAEVYDFKGLALDTRLPTPTGWTTMGDVRVGDTLFASDGSQCKVVAKSKVKNLPCYRVLFDDRTSVVCDQEHLWTLTDGSVVCVTELRTSHRIAVAQAIDTPPVELPIDPYLLGLWLADGKHTSGEITKPDDEVWVELVRRGHRISHDYSAKASDNKCRVHTVLGLRKALRLNGLLGNKHVPAAYMRASKQQRLELLRGLMDGDGTANTTRRQSVFTNTDRGLSDAVLELALSLGQRPKLHTVNMRGFGKSVVAHVVAFSPLNGVNPFLVARKADKVTSMMTPPVDRFGRVHGPRNYRRVVSVTPVDSVPSQCISVGSADHTFLCTDYFIPTHNTGKKKDDVEQATLYSASAFIDYDNIQRVKAGYIWLKLPVAKAIDKPITFVRGDLATMWRPFEDKYHALRNAYEHGVFPPKPSGLCAKWCDCPCEFNGKGILA